MFFQGSINVSGFKYQAVLLDSAKLFSGKNRAEASRSL